IKAAVDGGVAAFANSLTMNDYGTTPPELDNYNTLTIGVGGLSLNADAILKNFGTLSVGSIATLLGKAEISDQSVLQNYGQITLQDGGDFNGQSTITNFASGTIEVSGGTLNVLVGVANAGLVAVDSSAVLTLDDTS